MSVVNVSNGIISECLIFVYSITQYVTFLVQVCRMICYLKNMEALAKHKLFSLNTLLTLTNRQAIWLASDGRPCVPARVGLTIPPISAVKQ